MNPTITIRADKLRNLRTIATISTLIAMACMAALWMVMMREGSRHKQAIQIGRLESELERTKKAASLTRADLAQCMVTLTDQPIQ